MTNWKIGIQEDKNTGYKRLLLVFLYFSILIFPFSAFSRPVIADLALRKIDIDSGFTGTDILLFGARNDPGDIVVVVRGPERSYTVRKKERVAGIWVNKKQRVFNDVYGFNVVASNRPLEDIHNDYLLNSLHIGTDVESLPEGNDGEFKEALLKMEQDKNLYSPKIEEVSFIGDTLFRTVIRFPENIIRGVYTAEIYLFSDGQLSGLQSTPIIVSKKGFDAAVYDFAYKHPLLYGLLAVSIALFAGWIAGVIFRRV